MSREIKYNENGRAEENDLGIEIVGIRFDEEDYKVGESMMESRIWIDGEPTEDYLDGTSALEVNYTTDAVYSGRCYLIGGIMGGYGEDENEIIIRNAIVVAIIE